MGENFKPEVGFLRRSDFVESLAQLRISRRPASWQSVRRINLEFGLDYITNGERELENRLFQTALRTEMQSGDSWSVRYESIFEYVPAPFTLPGGILVPVGAYSNPFGVAVYTLGSQRKVSGEISTGHGGFYDGTRTDLSYRGRMELMPQLSLEPGIGVNWIDLPQGETIAQAGQRAEHLQLLAVDVAGGAAAVQLDADDLQQQRALQVGVPARQRPVRRLQRRA